jgi:hypothetical protein
MSVWTWINERFGSAVGPANQERRGAVGTMRLEDLAVPPRYADLRPFDD